MDPRSTSTYPRKRVLVACQTCRIKKTECDNQRPSCTTCIGLGVRCSYSGSMTDHSFFDAASLAILERVSHAVSLLEAQAKHMQQPTERPAVTGQFPMSIMSAAEAVLFESTIEEAIHEIKLLELSVNHRSVGQHILDWPIFGHNLWRKDLDAAVFNPTMMSYHGDQLLGNADLTEPQEIFDIRPPYGALLIAEG